MTELSQLAWPAPATSRLEGCAFGLLLGVELVEFGVIVPKCELLGTFCPLGETRRWKHRDQGGPFCDRGRRRDGGGRHQDRLFRIEKVTQDNHKDLRRNFRYGTKTVNNGTDGE